MTRVLHVTTPAEPVSVSTGLPPGVYLQRASVALPSPRPPVKLAGAYVGTRQVSEAAAIWNLTLQRFADEMSMSLREVGKVVERINEAWRDAGIVAEEPPTEPRERALWVKRNRGTGPATPAAWHRR